MELLGPILGLAGSIFGRPRRGNNARNVLQTAQGAIQAQQQYGINALELIRSNANADPGSTPRVGSVAALTNSFDQIADVLTGRKAQQDARQEVEDDLLRIERDIAAAQLATLGQRPALRSATLEAGLARNPIRGPAPNERIIKTDMGPVGEGEVRRPTPVGPSGSIDVTVDDGGTGTTIRPRERIVTSTGNSVDVTVGPDLDELMTGGAAEILSYLRSVGEDRKMGSLTADYYRDRAEALPPIQWDDRFGRAKPYGWDDWSNSHKMAWIRRMNQYRQ